jgi:hypothetical protein
VSERSIKGQPVREKAGHSLLLGLGLEQSSTRSRSLALYRSKLSIGAFGSGARCGTRGTASLCALLSLPSARLSLARSHSAPDPRRPPRSPRAHNSPAPSSNCAKRARTQIPTNPTRPLNFSRRLIRPVVTLSAAALTDVCLPFLRS